MRPTVFLVNQISGHGHLDLYARLYTTCFLDLGFRVALIAEHEPGMGDWLSVSGTATADDFVFLRRSQLHERRDQVDETTSVSDLARPAPPVPPIFARVVRVWRKEGIAGIALRFGVRAYWLFRKGAHVFLGSAPSFAKRLWRHFYDALRKRLPAADTLLGTFKRPGGIGFGEIVQEIQVASTRLGVRPILVVFLYLDMMSDDRKGCRALSDGLGAPWAGILFHPRYTGARLPAVERYFLCGNSRGAAFLNPHYVGLYGDRFPALRFGVLPDVTDARLATHDVDLVRRLRARASGRTIVLLFGSLSPRKGVLRLIDVIRRADPNDFFFAIIGKMYWDAYQDREADLRAFAACPPENCLFEDVYISDEGELNAVIAAADILYAVYTEAHNSSNGLTKAACFEKPILVGNGGLMGERVTSYKLGATADAGNVEDIIRALEALRGRSRAKFGFTAYRADHSLDALKRGLREIVHEWVGPADTLPDGMVTGIGPTREEAASARS